MPLNASDIPVHADWFTALVTNWVAATPMVAVLLVLIGFDIVTGLIAAVVTKKMSSAASFNGMLKKILMLSLVGVGVCMELLYSDIPWGRIFAMFFCFTEVISITENCNRAGVPLPKQLTETLDRMRESHAGKRSILGELKIDKVEVHQAKVESDIPGVTMPPLQGDSAATQTRDAMREQGDAETTVERVAARRAARTAEMGAQT